MNGARRNSWMTWDLNMDKDVKKLASYKTTDEGSR